MAHILKTKYNIMGLAPHKSTTLSLSLLLLQSYNNIEGGKLSIDTRWFNQSVYCISRTGFYLDKASIV